MLRERLGDLAPRPLARSSRVSRCRAASRCPALLDAAGAENVFTGHEDRLRHASGRGYADLARMRLGRLEAAPDAVLMPADAELCAACSRSARAEGVASSPSAAGPASSAASSRCAAPMSV